MFIENTKKTLILFHSAITEPLDFFSDMSGKPKFNYLKKKKKRNVINNPYSDMYSAIKENYILYIYIW